MKVYYIRGRLKQTYKPGWYPSKLPKIRSLIVLWEENNTYALWEEVDYIKLKVLRKL